MWIGGTRLSYARTAAAGAIVACYFLLLTRQSWTSYFDNDTLVNIAYLHGYGRVSLGVLLTQAVTVFTPEYRPVGGLYYRTLFALFGLNAAAFRAGAFGLLGLNLALAWRCVRELTGSRFTAAVATLLFSFHPAMAALYYSDGTIYDLLCFTFLTLALTRYVQIRRQDGLLTATNLLVVAALYGAALGSKEMALTFPGVLILYEAIFHPHLLDLRRRTTPIAVLATMTALSMAWKTMVPNPMSSNIDQAYTPHYDLVFIGHGYLNYYRQLLLYPRLEGMVLCVGLLAALIAAATLRNWVMLFGLLFANLTLLPVCVIPGRAGFVWYIPILGWALCGGSAIWQFSGMLARWLPRPVCQAALFGMLAIVAYCLYAPRTAEMGTYYMPEQTAIRSLITAALTASPNLPRGSRILFEGDPSDETSFMPLFLFRLGYGDASLWVEPVPHLAETDSPSDASLYAMTIRRTEFGYRVVTHPQPKRQSLQAAVSPAVIHRGQSVRAQFPVALAGCDIDVAYRMPEDELLRGGVWSSWMKLDARGGGTTQVSRDAERGAIVIDHVRGCRGEWAPVHGSFVIIP